MPSATHTGTVLCVEACGGAFHEECISACGWDFDTEFHGECIIFVDIIAPQMRCAFVFMLCSGMGLNSLL